MPSERDALRTEAKKWLLDDVLRLIAVKNAYNEFSNPKTPVRSEAARSAILEVLDKEGTTLLSSIYLAVETKGVENSDDE